MKDEAPRPTRQHTLRPDMHARFPFAAIALSVFVLPVSAADSIRCGSRIVSVEARAADILAACGQPDYRDVFSYPGPGASNEIADSEQWTYNFGSNQLLRVLKLRNGRLIDIESDGYGFPKAGSGRCSPTSIVDGLSKYRLVTSCGEPLTRRTVGFVNALKPAHQRRYGGFSTSRGYYSVEVFREEWVYNFGSRYLLKVVTLEDGMVAEVENGERGFNPR
ncbi:MAG: DUF2845 domain-containing protein [Panacagrimonas sp.]